MCSSAPAWQRRPARLSIRCGAAVLLNTVRWRSPHPSMTASWLNIPAGCRPRSIQHNWRGGSTERRFFTTCSRDETKRRRRVTLVTDPPACLTSACSGRHLALLGAAAEAVVGRTEVNKVDIDIKSRLATLVERGTRLQARIPREDSYWMRKE